MSETLTAQGHSTSEQQSLAESRFMHCSRLQLFPAVPVLMREFPTSPRIPPTGGSGYLGLLKPG